MTFHDVQLPDDVERGAQGGPRFKTTILTLSSGFEKRNIDWENTRGLWDIGYGLTSKTNFTLVQDFFYARQGRAHSFRFKDWSDFEVDRQSMFTTDGSTATFQLFKRYSSGGIDFDRDLTKPLGSDGLAWVNNISQTVVYDTTPSSTEVSIETLTGIVTLGSTHAATSALDVELQLEFDVPVRFDTDAFDLNLQLFSAGSIPQLPVLEVRGE